MPSPPPLISLSLLVASAAWAVRATAAESSFAGSSAALLGMNVVLLAVVAAAGIMLARSRWARRLALGLVVFELVLLIDFESDGWTFTVVGLCAVAMIGVAGPWLGRWVRHLPNAQGPPERLVVLLVGLAGLPAVAALSAPAGIGAGHVTLSAVALGSAFAFGRALPAGLWSIRILVPAAGVFAVLQSPLVGAFAITAIVATLVVLAWTKEATISVAPLVPTPSDVFRIPPELAPPELLREAGYDERGRPLQP